MGRIPASVRRVSIAPAETTVGQPLGVTARNPRHKTRTVYSKRLNGQCSLKSRSRPANHCWRGSALPTGSLVGVRRCESQCSASTKCEFIHLANQFTQGGERFACASPQERTRNSYSATPTRSQCHSRNELKWRLCLLSRRRGRDPI
jgi:hypothetical protein